MVWEFTGGGFRLPPAVALRDSKEYLISTSHITPFIKELKRPGPEKNMVASARTAIRIKEGTEIG